VRLPAVPQELTLEAEVPGMPGVRYLVPDGLAGFLPDAQRAVAAEQAYRAKAGIGGPLPAANFLAVSGGGDDGAFTAGILNGWTATGTRPEFRLVTGVSTGALIAPFAFLGPRYDSALRDFYTGVAPKDILEKRSLLSVVTGDGLADNAPLKQLVRKHVNAQMLAEIAAEHAKGRTLLVGTTNLDARRPVIWNLTKIAASGHPNSLELIQEIMVASAAIPGAFPPTLFDVEAGGKAYHEMHVDGGASAQVFVYPASFQLQTEAARVGATRARTLYVIRNTKLAPDWSDVERRTLSIIGRSISSLIQTQGIGDLYRIHSIAQRDGLEFNLAYIPASFNVPHKEEFDTDYMRALFKLGYEQALKGYPWEKRPPGM
jgi:predicted acylesterase/phospholipase RssA